MRYMAQFKVFYTRRIAISELEPGQNPGANIPLYETIEASSEDEARDYFNVRFGNPTPNDFNDIVDIKAL
jgi:hypothetical protein